MKTFPRIVIQIKGGTGDKRILKDWGDLTFLDAVDNWFNEIQDLELIGNESIAIEVHLMSHSKFNRLLEQQQIKQAQSANY